MRIETARELVCPFIQLTRPEDGGITFDEMPIHANILCITDKCMAWKSTQTDEYINGKFVPMKREKHDGYCKRLV